MSATLKAVFFDAAGTLIHLAQPVGENYRNIALNHGVDLSADSLEKAFRARWKSAPPRKTTSGPRPDDDKGWWRELVDRVLDDALPEAAGSRFDRESYFRELYAHFAKPGVWQTYPEAEEILDCLQERGVKLGVISNFDRRLHPVFDALSLSRYFTSITLSSETGVDKPDPLIFERALASLSVLPSEAVHVGDDPKGDWGAEVTGLDVFELDRPAKNLRDLLAWLETRL